MLSIFIVSYILFDFCVFFIVSIVGRRKKNKAANIEIANESFCINYSSTESSALLGIRNAIHMDWYPRSDSLGRGTARENDAGVAV